MNSSKSKSSREIYTRLLLQKEHGYPLWVPEPDGRLPEAYRGKGVSVGDVGILRNDGGFDYLFNACKPADDPVNKGRVPKGFEPIICADIREIETMHKRGSDIRSANVFRVEMSMGGAAESQFLVGGGGGFDFSCMREKGAILVLPDGGARYDALNLSQFRSYAARNAHAWYQFANIVCGREAANGSLYLVTGCDKTCSWGAASFFNSADTRSFSLKFLVKGVAEGNIKLGYSWKSTSSADVRAYPDGGSTYFIDSFHPNQCVFLRGFGISIRTNAFSQRVFGPTQISPISGTSKDRIPRFDSSMPYGHVDASSRHGEREYGSFMSLYPEVSPPGKRRPRQQFGEPLIRPLPVTPPPFLAPPTGHSYSDTSDTNIFGQYLNYSPKADQPSQEPAALQDLATWTINVDSTHDQSIHRQDPYAETENSLDFTPLHDIAMDTHFTSLGNDFVEDEFQYEENASKPLSIYEGGSKEIDAYNDTYYAPTRAPTLSLITNEHDVATGGTIDDPHWQKVSQQSGTPTPSSRKRRRTTERDTGDFVDIIQPANHKRRAPVVESEQNQDASVKENVHSKEKIPKLELSESSLHDSTSSGSNRNEKSDYTTKQIEHSAASYTFPQTLDVQMSADTHIQVEGVASTSCAIEPRHSDLETDNYSSSLPTLSSTQNSPGVTELTRFCRPKTELLNPCAMINEFILDTHPHANVAITHSSEWSSAMSEGTSSPGFIMQVLSKYQAVVHDGAGMLETW